MTLSFYYDFSIYSILISALWIFRDTTLVLWARTMKKRGTQSKYTNLLLVTGIILLAWGIISLFLPGVSISYSPEFESELRMFVTIFFLYDFIPIILGVFLGVVLSLYFYNMYFQHNKKALLGPGLFLLGYIIFLFFTIFFYIGIYSISSIDDVLLFMSNYNVYLIGFVLIKCISVVGFCFIFLYSIYINEDFLIMFCGLFFAYLTISLIHSINTAIIDFNLFG